MKQAKRVFWGFARFSCKKWKKAYFNQRLESAASKVVELYNSLSLSLSFSLNFSLELHYLENADHF